jgi:hypothetical protein
MSNSRAIPPHLIERSWEIYLDFMKRDNPEAGLEANQKLYYLGGFAACIGVLVGTLPVGIPEGTRTQEVIAQIVNDEIPKYQSEIVALSEAARLEKIKRERLQ